MADYVAERLKEIIIRFGPSILDEPARCEAVLRDYAGGHKKEINLLIAAIKAGVIHDLRANATGVSPKVILPKLVGKLEDEFDLSSKGANYAVQTLAAIVGLVDLGEVSPEKEDVTETVGAARQTGGSVVEPEKVHLEEGIIFNTSREIFIFDGRDVWKIASYSQDDLRGRAVREITGIAIVNGTLYDCVQRYNRGAKSIQDELYWSVIHETMTGREIIEYETGRTSIYILGNHDGKLFHREAFGPSQCL